MRFGTFLFTHAGPKGRDHEFIQETLAEARAAEDNGMDAVWLAEHHFDGTLAYVDPVSFAAALAMHTTRVKIGTAVVPPLVTGNSTSRSGAAAPPRPTSQRRARGWRAPVVSASHARTRPCGSAANR